MMTLIFYKTELLLTLSLVVVDITYPNNMIVDATVYIPPVTNNQKITTVFEGDSFDLTFTEVGGTNNIEIELNDMRLTSQSFNGWWVVEGVGTSALKNQNISKELMSSFKITVSYDTKALEEYYFTVMDVQVTDNFALHPEDAVSFNLACIYRGDELNYTIRWLFTTDDTCLLCKPIWRTVDEKHTLQTTININTEQRTSSLSIRDHGEEGYKYRVPEPLAAYSGVYACVIETANATAFRKVVVGSRPQPHVVPDKQQYVSAQDVMLTCHAYGYPLPTIDWYFTKKLKIKKEDTERVLLLNESPFSIDVIEDKLEAKSHRISTLRIRNLDEKTNRGIMACDTTNEYGTVSASYFLRIRNRNAFVVPLTGIGIQLALLIMFITFCKSHKQLKDDQLKRQRVRSISPPPKQYRPSIIPGSPLAGSIEGSLHESTIPRANSSTASIAHAAGMTSPGAQSRETVAKPVDRTVSKDQEFMSAVELNRI